VPAAASEFKHAPRECFLSRLNKVLLVLIAVGVALPLSYRSLPVVKEKAVQDTRLVEMEGRLEDARMLNKRLAREVNLLQNDAEYLGIFARDRVNPGYMKEGETIFRFAPQGQR